MFSPLAVLRQCNLGIIAPCLIANAKYNLKFINKFRQLHVNDMHADLFDGVISSVIWGTILRIDYNDPRFVAANGLLRPEREPCEVAVGHVAVLGARKKPRHRRHP